jgi:hypothetical protein
VSASSRGCCSALAPRGIDRLVVEGVTAVHRRTGSGLLKQVVERLALAVIERAEHIVLDRRQRALGLGELLRAGIDEFDQVPAPVLGRAPPFDELLGFLRPGPAMARTTARPAARMSQKITRVLAICADPGLT